MWNSAIHCFTCRLRTRKPGFKHNSSHEISQQFAPPICVYILTYKMKGLGHLWQSALGPILQQVSSKDHGLLPPINLKFQFLSIMFYSIVFSATKYNRNLPFLSLQVYNSMTLITFTMLYNHHHIYFEKFSSLHTESFHSISMLIYISSILQL